MHTSNHSYSSEANKPKGSKQKIFQLKEELNEGNLCINPKLEKLKVLRESYDIAKFRANELLQPHDKNLYIKVHGQRASKIYSALSTLIFVSLSNSKVEELEHYIMNSASQVPSSIFDLEEWSSIVKIAKDCREGDHSAQQEKLKLMRKNMQIFHQLAANPLRTTQMELKLLRNEVTNEVIAAQRELAGNINIIHQIIAEIQSTGGSLGGNTDKLSHLIHEHTNNKPLKSVSDKQKEDELKTENEGLKAQNILLQNSMLEQQVLITTLQAQLQATTMKSDELTTQNAVLTEQLRAQESQLAEYAQQQQKLTEEVHKQELLVQELTTAATAGDAVDKKESKPSGSAAKQARQAREYQELFEQYSATAGELESKDTLIAALQEQVEVLKQASEATATAAGELESKDTLIAALQEQVVVLKQASEATATALVVTSAAVSTHPSDELLLGELETVQSNNDALRASLESEISQKTELQESLITAEAAQASAVEEAQLAKQEAASAKETINQLRAELVEAEKQVQESPAAPITSTASTATRPVRFQDEEKEKDMEKKELKISTGEEQDLVSLITAEAIHSASAAVASAAARLVASLSATDAAAGIFEGDEESVQSLQSSLVESIVAHNEVLSSPQASFMVSALSPRELAETSVKLTASPSKPQREIELMEQNGDESSAITDEDEEEAVLSLIYAEAIHTASVAVSEAAARLIEGMSAERAKKDKELLELQSSLVDSLAAHGEVLKSPAKGVSIKTPAPAPPIASPSGRVHFRSGEDSIRKFDLNLPASAAVADVILPKKSVEAISAAGPAPLSVGFDEEEEKETLLSAITAEAIRTTSQAVSDAAARLVANLANASISTNTVVSLPSLISLQVNLADSLDAQSVVLKSPQVANTSAKLSELVATNSTSSSKLRSSESISPKNTQFIEVDPTVQSEEQLLLSLISAEAIHIASTSVTNAAAKLVALLTADDPAVSTSAEALKVQTTLTASLAAHSDAISSPKMINASQLSFLAAPTVEESAVPAVEESAVPAVEESAVPAVEESAVLAVEESAVPAVEESVVPSIDVTEVEGSDQASTKAAPTLRSIGGDADVVLVQNQLRGFVARARVRRIRQEKEAARQGVLAATKGTVQGESGWYKTADEQLFYFCMDKGEYVLLCGPIDDELYETACKLERPAESSLLKRTVENSPALAVDRIGLRATRLQIDMLTSDITTLETELEQLKHGVSSSGGNVESNANTTPSVLQQPQSEVITEVNTTSLNTAYNEIQALTAEITECKEMIRRLETDRRRSLLSRHASEIVKQKMVTLTIPQVVALVRLTSMVRGFLARARVKRIQTSRLALEVGVLSAMPNTIQGESGWYMGPKRAIFYFVLKGGEWINIAGPMTEEEFDIMQLDRKQKQITYSPEVLTHCPLQLDGNLPERETLLQRGALFCANVSDKLYLCTLLDDFIAAPIVTMDHSKHIPRVPSTEESISPNINSIAEISVKNTGVSMKLEHKSMLSATSAKVDAPSIDDTHESAKTE